jgi:hypothetical protein
MFFKEQNWKEKTIKIITKGGNIVWQAIANFASNIMYM